MIKEILTPICASIAMAVTKSWSRPSRKMKVLIDPKNIAEVFSNGNDCLILMSWGEAYCVGIHHSVLSQSINTGQSFMIEGKVAWTWSGNTSKPG